MDGRALILMPILLALMGCQTTSERMNEAYAAKAVAETAVPLPDLPDDCSAHIGPVQRRAGDMASHIIKRWEILADNRNSQADNCSAWWADYRHRMAR